VGITDYYLVGSKPDPTDTLGPQVLVPGGTFPVYPPGGGTVSYNLPNSYPYSYEWAEVTIPGAAISIANAPPVIEGTTGPLFATFTVTLSAASQDTITVNYATWQDGTAIPGVDYTAENGTLTFEPGSTTETINVPVTQESLLALQKTFNVVLSNPADANGGPTPTLATATAVGTIETPPAPDFNVVLGPSGYGTITATANGQPLPLSNTGSATAEIAYDDLMPIPAGTWNVVLYDKVCAWRLLMLKVIAILLTAAISRFISVILLETRQAASCSETIM
jgi:hypothetical protein